MRLANDLSIGTSTIRGTAYPNGAEVSIKVERDGKVIIDAIQKVSIMRFSQGLKYPLKEYDEVTITVSAPDFAALETSYSVY